MTALPPLPLPPGIRARLVSGVNGLTMHVLEGSREQIEAQLKMSLDAFFDFYPEI